MTRQLRVLISLFGSIILTRYSSPAILATRHIFITSLFQSEIQPKLNRITSMPKSSSLFFQSFPNQLISYAHSLKWCSPRRLCQCKSTHLGLAKRNDRLNDICLSLAMAGGRKLGKSLSHDARCLNLVRRLKCALTPTSSSLDLLPVLTIFQSYSNEFSIWSKS